MKKDNAGKNEKLGIRVALMKEIPEPVVLETHAGKGVLGNNLYRELPGVAFEKDEKKIPYLMAARPHWAVYEGDCVKAMRDGIGFHHCPSLVDIDPYGSPWEVIRAVIGNIDILPERFGIVVNDGLKRNLMLGCGWKCKDVAEYVQRIGNQQVCKSYPEVCRDLMEKIVREHGANIVKWAIRSGGYGNQMTHYAAVIKKGA